MILLAATDCVVLYPDAAKLEALCYVADYDVPDHKVPDDDVPEPSGQIIVILTTG
ncbi:MAG: hypothetical protein KBT53_04605 [Porticoccus sp.]|nr:hypothetical protein [Porticoccus sp.]MBQ0807693.1 hypothetical protein [Porticoccus sp.]